MQDKQLRLSVLLAQPGLEADIFKQGMPANALVDTGSDISMIPRRLAEEVYGGSPPLTTGSIAGPTHLSIALVPLTIGLKTTDGSLLCVQVYCAVMDNVADFVLGNDVLRQSGTRLTLDYAQGKAELERYGWQNFEQEVAQLYRSLGAKVESNVNLSGFQLDIVAEETTASNQRLRLAVECKHYKERVGNRLVNDFSRVAATLKEAGLIESAVLVSSSGFTQDARLVANTTGVELLTIEDLRQMVTARGIQPHLPSVEELREEPASKRGPRVFVVMPFASELEDIYYLGIQETVARMGGSCERADELEYVGGVLEKIYDSIRNADVIVAEITDPNPNVYYEIGFAHALALPVVLLSRDLQATPFDLRGQNHVIYSTIVELRERLERLLRHLLPSSPG